jgi:hypothetical protein
MLKSKICRAHIWNSVSVCLIALTAFLFIAIHAFAQSTPPTQTVLAQGIGKDVESVAKNAAENALIQVVGTFISNGQIFQ